MRRAFYFIAVAAVIISISSPVSAQKKADAGCEEKKTAKDEAAAVPKVEVAEMEPFDYAAIEMKGSYEQHPQAFMKLYSAAAQQGIPISDAPFGIYYNSPDETPEEELVWEIGMPVENADQLQPPIVLKRWDHTLVARMRYDGSIEDEDMRAAYAGISGWIDRNGYEPAGPIMERFLIMPSQDEKGGFEGSVLIIFPVQKKR